MKTAALRCVLVALALASVVGRTSADEAAGPLYFDYPALQALEASGVAAPADGAYEVWLWGKGPELAITIGEQKFQVASKDRFAWHHPGQVKLTKGQKVAVAFAKNEKPDDVTNVPGYLVLVADPNFDVRRTPLGYMRTLYEGSGFKPPASKDDWMKRREALRQQVLITNGMWPMPPKNDLKPQVYGKLVRDGYTIEKVVLETFPGFYLSGNLYRPAPWVPVQDDPSDVKARKAAWEKNRSAEKKPAILCPHGHWSYGRFEPEVQRRCKQLARMGAVVFSYDMVGRADSKAFGHAFLDPQIDLMGFSLMALQTWDSIRALDFISALPDVDTNRIACTGASGGGTQTFILAAIDDRIKVSAPIVMVSQDMQGGCACENASGLRHGTDNSEIAALFAPKPQVIVSCTQDWTKEFLTKGFPEVQATYKLFDKPDLVQSDTYDYPHNYNQTSRERVYAFFADHLFQFDPALSKELPMEPEAAETITTWDADHPRPAGAVDVAGLKKHLAGMVAEQALQFRPTAKEAWSSTREQLAGAVAVRLSLGTSSGAKLEVQDAGRGERDGYATWSARLGYGPTPRIRSQSMAKKELIDRDPTLVTVVVHPQGIAGVTTEGSAARSLAKSLVDKGHVVLAIDPYLMGENTNPFAVVAPGGIAHYTGYNRGTTAERVQDIVTALNFVRGRVGKGTVNLVGLGSAGPLCLLARTQSPFVARTVVDANQFDYRADSELAADQVLPGIVRLGGLRAAGTLVAPGRLFLHNTGDGLDTNWIEDAYRIENAAAGLQVSRNEATVAQIVAALQ
jgi:dienelactone hydrolase